MPDQSDARVQFVDGFVRARNWALMASHLVSLADAEFDHTRIFTFKEGRWGRVDVDLTVRSLWRTDRGLYCLGRDGRIEVVSPSERVRETLPDAGTGRGKLGYVHQIREIGSTLYVCGVAGQVYRRGTRGWAHFDEGVLDAASGVNALDLYSIDGSAEDNIYTVGERGLACRFDGASWRRLDIPTNRSLSRVRCVAPDQVYVCGDNGTFLLWNGREWEDHSNPKVGEGFWGVEFFEGKVYLAATKGLYVFDGAEVQPCETGLDPAPGGYRLHAYDGVMWSFGIDDLAMFDGKKWTKIQHPDNP